MTTVDAESTQVVARSSLLRLAKTAKRAPMATTTLLLAVEGTDWSGQDAFYWQLNASGLPMWISASLLHGPVLRPSSTSSQAQLFIPINVSTAGLIARGNRQSYQATVTLHVSVGRSSTYHVPVDLVVDATPAATATVFVNTPAKVAALVGQVVQLNISARDVDGLPIRLTRGVPGDFQVRVESRTRGSDTSSTPNAYHLASISHLYELDAMGTAPLDVYVASFQPTRLDVYDLELFVLEDGTLQSTGSRVIVNASGCTNGRMGDMDGNCVCPPAFERNPDDATACVPCAIDFYKLYASSQPCKRCPSESQYEELATAAASAPSDSLATAALADASAARGTPTCLMPPLPPMRPPAPPPPPPLLSRSLKQAYAFGISVPLSLTLLLFTALVMIRTCIFARDKTKEKRQLQQTWEKTELLRFLTKQREPLAGYQDEPDNHDMTLALIRDVERSQHLFSPNQLVYVKQDDLVKNQRIIIAAYARLKVPELARCVARAFMAAPGQGILAGIELAIAAR